jgi:hypothetical protein
LRGHDSDLKVAGQRELTLVDFAWIFAAIIVSFLICFCIVLFAKGTNHLAATQTELLLRTPDPVVVAQSSPESIPETLEQSAAVVNPPETQSPSSKAFSEVASQPAQGTPSRGAPNELATVNPKSSRILVGKGKEFSVKRLASRRRVARAPRSIKVLIEMWFRSFKAKSRRRTIDTGGPQLERINAVLGTLPLVTRRST